MEAEVRELKDMREHWIHWREEWQQKLLQNEVRYLRGLADLQASYDARSAKMDENYRTLADNQHADFEASLRRATDELAAAFLGRPREDAARVRVASFIMSFGLRAEGVRICSVRRCPLEYRSVSPERARRRLNSTTTAFSDRFRGSEEYVRERQRFYLQWFAVAQTCWISGVVVVSFSDC